MTWKPLDATHPIALSYEGLLTNAIISDDLKLWVGKYRVAFGYRLRAGFTHDTTWSELDICCGPVGSNYIEMFEKVKSIIENNPPGNPFKDIPTSSAIKPYYNDIDFCNTIDELYLKVA